ncbi:hypothetical protein QOT17_023124 [Balamuthia mandrillaris]
MVLLFTKPFGTCLQQLLFRETEETAFPLSSSKRDTNHFSEEPKLCYPTNDDRPQEGPEVLLLHRPPDQQQCLELKPTAKLTQQQLEFKGPELQQPQRVEWKCKYIVPGIWLGLVSRHSPWTPRRAFVGTQGRRIGSLVAWAPLISVVE